MINVQKLHAELVAAGVPVSGCLSDGRIDFEPEVTDQQRATAAGILAAHDPTPTEAQRLDELRLPVRLVAALAVRLSSSWNSLSPARQSRVQAIIDGVAPRIADALA